jgi:glutaredoxin 2
MRCRCINASISAPFDMFALPTAAKYFTSIKNDSIILYSQAESKTDRYLIDCRNFTYNWMLNARKTATSHAAVLRSFIHSAKVKSQARFTVYGDTVSKYFLSTLDQHTQLK